MFRLAAKRVTLQFRRALGRRSYATEHQPDLQERIGMASDRPWQMAALAITIPGVYYLRRGATRHLDAKHPGEIQIGSKKLKDTKPGKKAAEAISDLMTATEPLRDQASQAMQSMTPGSSGSSSAGANTPSSGSVSSAMSSAAGTVSATTEKMGEAAKEMVGMGKK